MKAILKNLLLLTVVATTVISCNKDVERTVLKPGGDNQLTITSATLVLLQANAANVATVFGWGKADFGYDAASPPTSTNSTSALISRASNWLSCCMASIQCGSGHVAEIDRVIVGQNSLPRSQFQILLDQR